MPPQQPAGTSDNSELEMCRSKALDKVDIVCSDFMTTSEDTLRNYIDINT